MKDMRKIALYLFAVTLLVGCGGSDPLPDAELADSTAVAPTVRDSVVIMLVASDSTTPFALLESNHNVTAQTSAMGVFVSEIDSVANSDGAYWLYSVNGEMIPKASDRYEIGPGDTVRWMFKVANEQ